MPRTGASRGGRPGRPVPRSFLYGLPLRRLYEPIALGVAMTSRRSTTWRARRPARRGCRRAWRTASSWTSAAQRTVGELAGVGALELDQASAEDGQPAEHAEGVDAHPHVGARTGVHLVGAGAATGHAGTSSTSWWGCGLSGRPGLTVRLRVGRGRRRGGRLRGRGRRVPTAPRSVRWTASGAGTMPSSPAARRGAPGRTAARGPRPTACCWSARRPLVTCRSVTS